MLVECCPEDLSVLAPKIVFSNVLIMCLTKLIGRKHLTMSKSTIAWRLVSAYWNSIFVFIIECLAYFVSFTRRAQEWNCEELQCRRNRRQTVTMMDNPQRWRFAIATQETGRVVVLGGFSILSHRKQVTFWKFACGGLRLFNTVV